MLRKLLLLMGLAAAIGTGTGCSMCQDCLDDTGVVPDAPNFGNYYHSPRVGSADVMVSEAVPAAVDDEPIPE